MIKEWELLTTFDLKNLLWIFLAIIFVLVIVSITRNFGKDNEEDKKEAKYPRPHYLDSLELYLAHEKKVVKVYMILSMASVFGFMWFAIDSYFVFAGLCIFSSMFWMAGWFTAYHEKEVHPQESYEEALKYQTKLENEEQENLESQSTLDYHLNYEKKTDFVFSLAIVAIITLLTWAQFDLFFLFPIMLLAILTIELTFAFEEKRALSNYEEVIATTT